MFILKIKNFIVVFYMIDCTVINSEIICDFPGKPRHGHLDGTIPSKFGGVISFSCSDGFALVGEEHRVCQANSQWGGTQPKCESKFSHQYYKYIIQIFIFVLAEHFTHSLVIMFSRNHMF